MYLYHYYESTGLPFANLSDLSVNEANAVLNKIKKETTSVRIFMHTVVIPDWSVICEIFIFFFAFLL